MPALFAASTRLMPESALAIASRRRITRLSGSDLASLRSTVGVRSLRVFSFSIEFPRRSNRSDDGVIPSHRSFHSCSPVVGRYDCLHARRVETRTSCFGAPPTPRAARGDSPPGSRSPRALWWPSRLIPALNLANTSYPRMAARAYHAHISRRDGATAGTADGEARVRRPLDGPRTVVAGAGEPGASRRQGPKRPGGPVRL